MERTEKLLESFKESFKEDFFNDKFQYEVKPCDNLSYLAEFEVQFNAFITIGFAVSKEFEYRESYVCVYNDLLKGMFDKHDDIERLQSIAKSRLPELNEEVAEAIQHLENEIEKLKKNGISHGEE